MSMAQKNHIGLTGSIGAGKSTVSERFRQLGALVLDADAISRSALERGGCCYAAAIGLFGDEIVRADGSIDRKRVAALIFADEALRQQLNALIHPAVQAEMLRLAAAEKDLRRPVIFDVPLLFESGWEGMMHRTIVVTAEDAVRMQRVCARDGCTEAEAMARVRAQMPQEEKARRADFVVENSGDLNALYEQVDALYARLCGSLA